MPGQRDDPRAFFVYEEYLDVAAFQHHLAADYSAEFNRALAPLIEEDESRLTHLEAL